MYALSGKARTEPSPDVTIREAAPPPALAQVAPIRQWRGLDGPAQQRVAQPGAYPRDNSADQPLTFWTLS